MERRSSSRATPNSNNPVEAGPGLRLIRDAVGSVRVDRIRRQKADLEDILTHVQGETPETARLLANSMAEERRTRILNYYENMKGGLVFTPWQVAVSEALRDGDAASAIAALHLRGRFHIGYDGEKTLTGLVDDWDRYQRANSDKSSVVLARTRAEVRAISHLMRERRFAALPDSERTDVDRVTVIVSRKHGRTNGQPRRWRSRAATGCASAPPTGRSSCSTAPWSRWRTSSLKGAKPVRRRVS